MTDTHLTIPSPSDTQHFGYTPLPDWVESFREQQWDIIEQVDAAFQEVDVVFLQAPTGTGKTLIGEVARRKVGGQGIYACSTKALQDQFAHDFPYAKVIKGRNNYLTESGKLDQFGNVNTSLPYSAITCADCTFNESTGACRWCRTKSLCPYTVVRNRAEMADLAVVNTSYFFTIVSKVGQSGFLGRELAIIDEADLLETELLNHIELNISSKRMEQMRISPPTKKTVESAWPTWVTDEALPKVRAYKATLTPASATGATADDIKEWNYTANLIEKLNEMAIELPKGGWVYDGYDSGNVIFKPIMVGKYGAKILWPHAQKFLLMSATILSADLMAEELGLNGSYTLIDVPSDFPVANRPIHVTPVADMAYKNREEAWPKMAEGVDGVLRRHMDERILVHTVSYDLARYLNERLASNHNRPIYTYTSSRNKAEALREYSRHPNAVLLAPSMDRGIDLPGDLCRVQVIAKVPFPNVKDKRISARMYREGGTAWYRMQTIRTIIQMTGRGVRSKDDHATTYILDAQFSSNLMKSEYLFPKWWKDALDFSFSPRKLLSNKG